MSEPEPLVLRPDPPPSDRPDEATRTAWLDLRQRDYGQNIPLRKWFAVAIIALTVLWLGTVLALIGLSAYKPNEFMLPEAVQVALLGSATGGVLGALYLVLKYLFNPERSE